MTALAKARLDVFGGLTAGGTANALTVTTNQVLVSAQLTGGAALMIKAASTNTSATVTFAPDGLTAAPIKRADGSALAVGSIQAGMFLLLVYNSGTSEWWAANIAPAASLAPNALSTAPSTIASFSAYNGSAQFIGNASVTKLTFPTAEWNIGSFYNTSNSRWTPPAGTIQITAGVNCFVANAGAILEMYLYKNGSLYRNGNQNVVWASGTGTNPQLTSSWLAQASGTDYFEAYAYQSTGSNQNTNAGSGAQFFQGTML
jgi:hypothetical protein